MNRYAALLRGIAPSNPNMKNDRLRGVFEELGLEHVTSVLASGNILFRSEESDVPALESRIQKALTERLGIGGGTIIREHAELRDLLDRDPFDGLVHGRGSYLTVTFLKDGTPEPDLPELDDPRMRIVGYDRDARAVLTVIDNSEPGSTPDFMGWLERTHGKDITTRTWLTVQRIVTKLEA